MFSDVGMKQLFIRWHVTILEYWNIMTESVWNNAPFPVIYIWTLKWRLWKATEVLNCVQGPKVSANMGSYQITITIQKPPFHFHTLTDIQKQEQRQNSIFGLWKPRKDWKGDKTRQDHDWEENKWEYSGCKECLCQFSNTITSKKGGRGLNCSCILPSSFGIIDFFFCAYELLYSSIDYAAWLCTGG